MTNAEKFLKEGAKKELIADLANYIRIHNTDTRSYLDILHTYFDKTIKPILNEDERAILRNIKGYTTIIRNTENNIQVENEDGSFACLCAFNHLFQFIKKRRKILNRRIIGREK